MYMTIELITVHIQQRPAFESMDLPLTLVKAISGHTRIKQEIHKAKKELDGNTGLLSSLAIHKGRWFRKGMWLGCSLVIKVVKVMPIKILDDQLWYLYHVYAMKQWKYLLDCWIYLKFILTF